MKAFNRRKQKEGMVVKFTFNGWRIKISRTDKDGHSEQVIQRQAMKRRRERLEAKTRRMVRELKFMGRP